MLDHAALGGGIHHSDPSPAVVLVGREMAGLMLFGLVSVTSVANTMVIAGVIWIWTTMRRSVEAMGGLLRTA